MAETTTLARPYAKAVFELANAEHQFKEWSNQLLAMANIAMHPEIIQVLKNPRVSSNVAASLFIEAGDGVWHEQAKNFIQLLAQYRRLVLLPEIAALFEQYRAEAEKTLMVEVSAPFPLPESQEQQLKIALEKRFARTVSLSFHLDPELIGGAVIRAGDYIIDSSVSTRLTQLADTLNS
jgi:F-type H+-transporting ATPase subunit delta